MKTIANLIGIMVIVKLAGAWVKHLPGAWHPRREGHHDPDRGQLRDYGSGSLHSVRARYDRAATQDPVPGQHVARMADGETHAPTWPPHIHRRNRHTWQESRLLSSSHRGQS